MFLVKIRILRNDLSIEKQIIKIKEKNRISKTIALIGSRLRKKDPAVCAIRNNICSQEQWLGHITDDQMDIIANLERKKISW